MGINEIVERYVPVGDPAEDLHERARLRLAALGLAIEVFAQLPEDELKRASEWSAPGYASLNQEDVYSHTAPLFHSPQNTEFVIAAKRYSREQRHKKHLLAKAEIFETVQSYSLVQNLGNLIYEYAVISAEPHRPGTPTNFIQYPSAPIRAERRGSLKADQEVVILFDMMLQGARSNTHHLVI